LFLYGGILAGLSGTEFQHDQRPLWPNYWEPKSGKDNLPRPMAGQPVILSATRREESPPERKEILRPSASE